MNLQQLRFVREAIRQNFNLTEAANRLFTSQPGVSKAIIELEDELGVKIFERKGKRIKGLTRPGQDVAQVIERIMREIDNLKLLSQEYAQSDEGSLTIACTHTQARYALPKVIPEFRRRFPRVHLSLVQGSPSQLAELVLTEQADLAIATETLALTQGLVTLDCYEWQHVLIAPPDHPLIHDFSAASQTQSSQTKSISLGDISHFPIVTYEQQFTGRSAIDRAFVLAEVKPDIVLEAIDADVIKTYVELGLGVGLIAGVAFDEERDVRLKAIPVGHLFGVNTTKIGIKEGVFLRDYVYTFIELLTPHLSRQEVATALSIDR